MELDTLDIQIKTSTKDADDAIKQLTKSLVTLGSALSMGSLNTFIVRMERLSDVLKRFDGSGLKQMSDSLDKLQKAGNKLSNFGLDKVTKQANNVSVAAKVMSDKIAREWGITDKNAVRSLAMAIENMYSVAGNDAEVGKAISVVDKLIREYARIGSQADETAKKIREMVSASTLYVPSQMKAEWGNDYKSNMGVLGIRNTTTDPTKGTSAVNLMRDINSAMGGSADSGILNTIQSEEDALSALVQYLKQAQQATMSYNEALTKGAVSTGRLDHTLNSLAQTVGTSASAASRAALESGQSYSQMAGEITAKVEQLKSVAANADPFGRFIEGINALKGVAGNLPDFTSLERLAASVNKLGGTAAGKAGQAMTEISKGLQSIKGVGQVSAIGGDVDTLTQQLRALGSGSIVNASKSLSGVASGLMEIKAVGDVRVNGLADLAQSLSMFGRSSAQQAITTIPQLATAFNGLIATLSTAPNIKQSVIDLANAMANLCGNMKAVPAATARANRGLTLFSNHAHKTQKATFNLTAAIGKLYAKYWLLLRIGRWVGKSLTLASDLVEVQNVVDNVFGDMSDKMDDFAKHAVDTLGMSELTAKKIGSRFQSMGKNMGVPDEAIRSTNEYLTAVTKMGDGTGKSYAGAEKSMADISLNLTKLAGDLASFYNEDYEDVAKTMESIFTGQTRPMRRYGLDLTENTLREYALKNGLDANIKAMSQYEKMLLRYQYVMAHTTAAQGDFLRTSDTWANQIKIAKERLKELSKVLGTIGLHTFKPLVKSFNNAMNSIIHLAESTLNALGKIFGWKVEITDVGTVADDTEDISENLDDAAGSAKKMKDYMLGIDELNVFNENDGKGGGGGGASGGADAAEDALVKWEKTAEGYDSIYDTLYKLGKRIGEVEKEWLQGIDWNDIYVKAEKFGKGLASFLNGYLSDAELFYEKGRFVANAINMIAHALKAFAEEFDGYQLGVDIGSWINGLTNNIDIALLNKTAYEVAHDIAEAINAAVATTNWDMLGRTIAGIINAKIHFAATLIKETDFAAIGKAIGAGLNGFIRTLNVRELAETLRGVVKGAIDLLCNLLSTTDFATLGKKIGEFLKELKLGDFITDIARLVGNVIIAALELVPSMIMEAPFESALLLVIGTWKFTRLGTTVGTNLGTAIATGFKTSLLPKISYIMTTDMAAVWGNATIGRKAAMIGMGLGGSIVAGFVGFKLGQGIAYVIADVMGDEETKDIIRNMGERWGNIWSDGFVEGAKQVGAGIAEMFKKDVGMGDSIADTLGGSISAELYEKLDRTGADISRTFKDVLDDIQRGVIRLEQEDFTALKDAMNDAGVNAIDSINLVNQLETAQKNYYELFPAWLEQENSIKAAVDNHGMSRETAYQIFLKSIEAKKEETAVTDILTTSEDALADASGTAGDAADTQAEQIAKLNEQLAKGEISGDEYLKKLEEVNTGMDTLTETTKKTTSSFNGMPSSIASAVTAMNESSDATLSAEEESAKFQELWNNYTISNVDISQLHEINTVLEDINNTSTNLVTVLEDNFGSIFSSLETKLGNAKTAITNFDTELNQLLTTLFDETIPTDFETTTENLDTFLTTTDEAIGTFDEELGKKIDTLFDETLPGKFEDTEKALSGSLGNAETAIGDTIGNVKKKFEEFLKWFDKNILEKTKAEYWTNALSGVSGAFETTFRGVANAIATIMNSLIEQINSAMNVKWDNLIVNGQTVMAAGQAKLFEITPIPLYERGGFPEDGLFYANHNEMVGRFSNGRTAVANNEQIVGGIREGVQAAMSDVVFNMLNPYLSDIAQSSRETANKDFSVNIGDRDIAMANNRGQSLVGMSIIS